MTETEKLSETWTVGREVEGKKLCQFEGNHSAKDIILLINQALVILLASNSFLQRALGW